MPKKHPFPLGYLPDPAHVAAGFPDASKLVGAMAGAEPPSEWWGNMRWAKWGASQGPFGACVAAALAQWLFIRMGTQAIATIPQVYAAWLQIYADTRKRMGTWPTDSGSWPGYAIAVLNEVGYCAEEKFAYRGEDYTETLSRAPDLDTYEASLGQTWLKAHRIDTDETAVAEFKLAAVSGRPCTGAIAVDASFDWLGDGIWDGVQGPIRGYHYIMFPGDYTPEGPYILNSWPGWGAAPPPGMNAPDGTRGVGRMTWKAFQTFVTDRYIADLAPAPPTEEDSAA